MRKLKEYALYYDDELIIIGTIKELSKYMGLTEDSTRQLVSPSKQKISRKKIIKIEGEY